MGGSTIKKAKGEEVFDESGGPSEMNTEDDLVSELTLSDEDSDTTRYSTSSDRRNYEAYETVRTRKLTYSRKRKIGNKNTMDGETSVNNRFEPLSRKDDSIDDNIDDDNTQQSEEQEISTKNFPPIVVKTGMPIKAFISEVNTYIKPEKAINFKNGRQKISIYTTSNEDFKKVQQELISRGHEFHTFSIKEERVKRLVIKGISSDYTPTEVEADLKRMGLDIIKVNNMYKAKNVPSNMFLVNFPKTTQLNTVLKSNKYQYICYQKVQWCKYKTPINKSVQCYRCQGFGHSSSNCNYKSRCVKCTAIHEPGKCPKTETEKPKCANCEGEHPANYRQCPNYISYVSKLEINRSKQNIKKKRTRPLTVFTTPNISYSNITKNQNMTNFPSLPKNKPLNSRQTNIASNINIPTQITPTQNLPSQTQRQTVIPPSTENFSFAEEVRQLFKCNLFELGAHLSTFLPQYKQCTDKGTKMMLILDFIAQFQ